MCLKGRKRNRARVSKEEKKSDERERECQHIKSFNLKSKRYGGGMLEKVAEVERAVRERKYEKREAVSKRD